MSGSLVLVVLLVVLAILAGSFIAVGLNLAIGRGLSLLGGHLERLQGKLDVLVAAQAEHNEKLDAILWKLL